jgi:tetrahydromethanopterin S-methyltransferase subunit B
MEKIMADIQRLEKKVDQVENCMDKMATDVRDIKNLLMGNSLVKTDTGIIGELTTMKERVAKLEKIKDRLLYSLVAAAVFGGWGVTDLFIKLFTK